MSTPCPLTLGQAQTDCNVHYRMNAECNENKDLLPSDFIVFLERHVIDSIQLIQSNNSYILDHGLTVHYFLQEPRSGRPSALFFQPRLPICDHGLAAATTRPMRLPLCR